MPSYVQNAHDHPLIVVYKGTRLGVVLSRLIGIFSKHGSTHDLHVANLAELMPVLMPIHFARRQEEYMAFSKLEVRCPLLLAFVTPSAAIGPTHHDPTRRTAAWSWQ